MKRDNILNLGLIAGLVITLVFLGGCTTEQAPTGGGFSWQLIIILVLFIGMFYFLLIRPLRKREQTHDRMVDDLEPGDMVITAGGMYGQVESIDKDSIVLKVESGATIRVA